MLETRSHTKELLDGDNIPEADLFQNLKELDTINTLLGGYNITFSALHKIIKSGKQYAIMDIGCGGGDTLKHIVRWGNRNQCKLRLTGVDIKSVCIDYAKKNTRGSGIDFICDDYRRIFQHQSSIDIIHASLFCHHLSEEQIIELIQFSLQNNTILVINDLERNPLAYYSIKWLTALCSKSYLVKNDAPLSVARGFKRKEWITILKKSGAKNYSVQNKWAFRHEIIVYANND